jgi:hypothetical protein
MISMQTTRSCGSNQRGPAAKHPEPPMVSAGRALVPVGLLGAEAGVVTVLHRLGSVPFLRLPQPDAAAWREWLELGAPADVLATLVRAAALGAAWWLLVSTILYLAARLGRSASGVRLAGRLAPAVVRRFVDGMVVVSVAGALAGGRTGVARVVGSPQPPAGRTAALVASVTDAGPAPEGIVLRADVGRGIVYPLAPPASRPSADSPEHQVVPGGTLAPDALLTAPPLAPPPSQSGAAAVPSTAAGAQQAQEPPGASSPPGVPLSAGDAREGSAVRTVQPGESLWTITAGAMGAERSDARSIGPYWLEVVEANRGRIASGDPDLILPGETIVMPLMPASPDRR